MLNETWTDRAHRPQAEVGRAGDVGGGGEVPYAAAGLIAACGVNSQFLAYNQV